MSAKDKRVRKKQHRDARVSARSLALRRRRYVRLIAVGVVLALLVGFALAAGGGSNQQAANDNDSGSNVALPQGCATESRDASPQEFAAPEQVLEEGVDYAAVIETSCGDITMDLLEDKAPATVNSFAFLARQNYYAGLPWHRIERNSVIQTGDPNGENGVPPDGPGYTIPDEPPKRSKEYVYGVVGLANAGPDTGGSQFFIVVHTGPNGETDAPAGFPPDYTIFGKVDESSYETLERLRKVPIKEQGSSPAEEVEPVVPVYIRSVEIVER